MHIYFSGDVHFFCFKSEILFLGKFGPKTQKSQFKLKFGIFTNSNIQNSMVMFPFSVLDQKYTFSENLFKVKFGN